MPHLHDQEKQNEINIHEFQQFLKVCYFNNKRKL